MARRPPGTGYCALGLPRLIQKCPITRLDIFLSRPLAFGQGERHLSFCIVIQIFRINMRQQFSTYIFPEIASLTIENCRAQTRLKFPSFFSEKPLDKTPCLVYNNIIKEAP